MLMKALKVGLEQKGGLRFLNPSAPVARVLEISGLSSHAYSGSESDAADLLRKCMGRSALLWRSIAYPEKLLPIAA
jgi:hypothetical protein